MTTAEMRAHARLIFEAALQAADPGLAVHEGLKLAGNRLTVDAQTFDLADFDRVLVVGAGKAAAAMAAAVEEILDERITAGLIVTKYGHGVGLKHIDLREAGHPVPDEAGLAAARAILELLKGCGERDLVIALLSGGGSALLPLPPANVSLAQKQALTQALLNCGASIHELNTVRKHFSRAKGGGLARAAHPATIINLMLSDVTGDAPDVIAAGPFVADRSSFEDTAQILARYGLMDKLPKAMLDHLRSGIRQEGGAPPSETAFAKVTSQIVANNRRACLAAKAAAERLGYHTVLLSTSLGGNTTDSALMHSAIAREALLSDNPAAIPACILSGGETTVVVKGQGKGGRNQEFAAICAREIDGLAGEVVVLCGGTDGTDGPTEAAGGLVDTGTLSRGLEQGADISSCLADNDSYHYLKATGDLLLTGPTRTNVMDVRIVLVNRGPSQAPDI